jgi:hypothetical protein
LIGQITNYENYPLNGMAAPLLDGKALAARSREDITAQPRHLKVRNFKY